MSGSGQEFLLISGSGRETLPNVREWSGGPAGCPGVVERPSQMFGSCREPLTDIREWSRDPSEFLGVVRRSSWPSRGSLDHFRMSGRGREAFRMSGSGQKDIPNVRERSGDLSRRLGVVGWLSRMSRNGREALLDD